MRVYYPYMYIKQTFLAYLFVYIAVLYDYTTYYSALRDRPMCTINQK